MLKKHRNLIIACVIIFLAFLIGLYGFSVGSSYKQTIVIAYENFYNYALGHIRRLVAFLKDELNLPITLPFKV